MSAALLLFVTRSMCNETFQLRQNIIEIRTRYAHMGDAIIFSHQPHTRNICMSIWVYQELINENPTTVWTLDKDIHIDNYYPIKKPSLSVIYFEETNKINETIDKLRNNRLWNAYGNTLILVEEDKLAETWLSSLWYKTLASNIVVLVPSLIKYYTWHPYSSKDCTQVNEIYETSVKRLYQYKPGTNHYNCSIKVICRDIYPYVVSDEKHLTTQGVESTLLLAILQKFHFGFEFIKHRDFFWNVIRPDGSPGGGLKAVYEHEADVAYSGLQRRVEYGKYAEMLMSHTEDTLAWFVPTPMYISNLEKIQRALKPRMWGYISAAYVLVTMAVIVITLATKSGTILVTHSILDSIMNSMKAYLGAAILMPKHHLLKFLYMVLYVYSIHVTIIYQSALIYMLSNKISEVPISSVQEALDRNMEFHFYDIHRNLVNDSDWWLWPKISEKKLAHVHSPVPPFRDIQRKGVFIGPRAPQPTYLRNARAVDEFGQLTFFPLKESFMVIAMVFIMTPGHPLAPLFENATLYLMEGGFCQWWLKNMEERPWDLVRRENEPLTVESLVGAFILISTFSIVAMIVFLFELVVPFVQRCIKRRSRKNKKTETKLYKKRRSLPKRI